MSLSSHFRPSHSVYPSQRIIPKGNVAAVEPYIHMPQQKPIAMVNKQKQHVKMVQDLANLKLNLQDSNNQKNANNTHNNNSTVNVNHIQFPESDETKLARQMLHMKQHSQDFDLNANADIVDFVTSTKSDGKSHTLSYNVNRPTKCSASGSISSMVTTNQTTTMSNPMLAASKIIAMSKECFDDDDVETVVKFNPTDCNSLKVEHETEIKRPKSGLQRPSGQNELLSAINKTVASTVITSTPTNGNQRSDGKTVHKSKLSTAHQIPSGNLVVPPRKPISSVAPTSITPSLKSTIPSPRVHAVAPNINSTPILSTTESLDKSRPALPPKPNKNNDSNSSNSSSSNESSPSSSGSGSSIASASRSKSSIAIPTTITFSEKATYNEKINVENVQQISSHIQAHTIDFPIKAKPLTIKKQPLSEQPRLRSLASGIKPIQYSSRRIEMPATLLFSDSEKAKPSVEEPKMPHAPSILIKSKSPPDSSNSSIDENDKSPVSSVSSDGERTLVPQTNEVVRRQKTSMSDTTKVKLTRRVSFDPLALLLDASLEGELELVQKTATQVHFHSGIYITAFISIVFTNFGSLYDRCPTRVRRMMKVLLHCIMRSVPDILTLSSKLTHPQVQ